MTRKITRIMMAYTFNKAIATFWVLALCAVLTIHIGDKVLDHYGLKEEKEQTTNASN